MKHTDTGTHTTEPIKSLKIENNNRQAKKPVRLKSNFPKQSKMNQKILQKNTIKFIFIGHLLLDMGLKHD